MFIIGSSDIIQSIQLFTITLQFLAMKNKQYKQVKMTEDEVQELTIQDIQQKGSNFVNIITIIFILFLVGFYLTFRPLKVTIQSFQNSKQLIQQIQTQLGLNNQYLLSNFTSCLPQTDQKIMQQFKVSKLQYESDNNKFKEYIKQQSEQAKAFSFDKQQQKYDQDIQHTQITALIYQNIQSFTVNQQCLLVNAIQQGQISQQALFSQLKKIKQLRSIVWLFHSKKQAQNFIKLVPSYIDFSIQAYRIDSTYQFLKKPLNNCIQIIYGRSQFIFKQVTFPSLQQYNQLIYSPPQENNNLNDESRMEPVNITQVMRVDREFIAQHLLIFNIKLLDIITPTNFMLFNKYTLTQIICYPLIVAFRNSEQIIQSKPVHYLKSIIDDKQLFSFVQLDNDNSHLCFLNFPQNFGRINLTQYEQYLEKFNQTKPKNISIITSLRYLQKQSLLPFYLMALSLSQRQIYIKVKVKIKLMTSIEWYQASFIYCPKQSTFFSSRHNMQPLKQAIISSQIRNLCPSPEKSLKNHSYYIIPGAFLNKYNKNIVQKPYEKLNYEQDYPIGEVTQKLLRSQIFCGQLIRSINFQNLRWKQNQFYQSQFPTILQLLLRVQRNFSNSKKIYLHKKFAIFKPVITLDILISQQMNGYQNRLPFLKINNTLPLNPLQFNYLKSSGFTNKQYEFIPRIIHQISLSSISSIQKALIQTVKYKNPSFQYRMWKKEDLVEQKFPYTFKLIRKIQQLQPYQTKMIEQLMKLQILYHYGGIFVDKKYEAKKSLGPFTKFKTIFADIGSINLQNDQTQQYFITKVMGFRKNDPKLLSLIQTFVQNTKIFKQQDYNANIVGIVLSQLYTEKQKSIQILFPKDLVWRQPKQKPYSICHYLGRISEPQNAYKTMYRGQQIMLEIPCPYNYYYELES